MYVPNEYMNTYIFSCLIKYTYVYKLHMWTREPSDVNCIVINDYGHATFSLTNVSEGAKVGNKNLLQTANVQPNAFAQ